jgi:Txe/YoeB family toxin of Txe-Axe toxin-antitoxin module
MSQTQIILADTLLDSLSDLEKDERLRVLDFIDELRRSAKSTGLSLERLNNTRSKNLWSGRISQELRAILYQDGDTWAILHAGHHDPAYRWAERRDIGRNRVTGAFQIVETIETVRTIEREIVVEPSARPLFAGHDDAYLLSLGVPETWLPTLRKLTGGDQLLDLAPHFPPDVHDRLLRLADGELVTPPAPVIERPLVEGVDSRRFFVLEDDALLRAALDAPLDRWIAFLHPTQRRLVTASFTGPAKVSGSAGTGKTVVALHRARHLARQGKRVLLTSYVRTLCGNLERNLRLLCTDDERRKITVSTVHAQALALARHQLPALQPARDEDIDELLRELAPVHAPGFDRDFVTAEWRNVIVPQGLTAWPEYRAAQRTGRGKAISVRDRKTLWTTFEALRERLLARNQLDWAAICHRATDALTNGSIRSPFDAILVDEVQDLSVPELRLIKALAGTNLGELVLFGDTGQRIYAGGFSLGALGIDVRGRSTVLRINYRTTEQIRRAADRLLGDTSDDMDDGSESRKGTRSILRGPPPSLQAFAGPDEEAAAAVAHLRAWIAGGLRPETIAVFARTNREVKSLQRALTDAGLLVHLLADEEDGQPPAIALGTMHRAKGLEFKAVLVANCTETLVPFHLLLAKMTDPQDREHALDNERRLLYVAMTRARDELRITWSRKPSPFLAPLIPAETPA